MIDGRSRRVDRTEKQIDSSHADPVRYGCGGTIHWCNLSQEACSQKTCCIPFHCGVSHWARAGSNATRVDNGRVSLHHSESRRNQV